jgi:hypothetical protein
MPLKSGCQADEQSNSVVNSGPKKISGSLNLVAGDLHATIRARLGDSRCDSTYYAGGKRSQRRGELEPYHRTIHCTTCCAIDRDAITGVRRSS